MLGLTDANVSEDKVWGVLDCLIRFLRCRLRDEFVQPIYLNDCLWEKEPANEEWLGTKHGMIFVYKKSQSLNHRSKRKKMESDLQCPSCWASIAYHLYQKMSGSNFPLSRRQLTLLTSEIEEPTRWCQPFGCSETDIHFCLGTSVRRKASGKDNRKIYRRLWGKQ